MLEAMETCVMTDFENVCRICMKFDETFLSITTFKIIDMIIACASVQIWENDDLPKQICHACFLQLQNTINFKQLCENSDHAFRQIIEQNKINNENDFANVKDEEFEDYGHDYSLIDIKDEEIDRIEEESKKSEQDNMLEIKNIEKLESNKMQIGTTSEEESDTCEDINGDDNVTKTFICEKCNKEFKRLWVLGVHMHRIHKVNALKCNQCKLKFYHPLHLKEHQELTHNKLNHTCNKCGIVYLNIYRLKYHKCEDIKGDDNVTKTFICEKCNREFKRLWVLGVHMHRIHKANALKCNQCNLKFYHPLHLKEHQELTHNKLNHTCNKCGIVCLNIYRLKYHKCKRNSLKLLQCPRCDKSFEDKRDLKCHIKEAHKRTELYVACHICGKSVLKKNIKIHLVIHNEREKIKCEICSKTFLLQLSLSNHIKYVHENQQPARNHLCNICGHAARSTSDLRMHLTSHSNERPYACDQCDKTYKIADNLRDHVRRVHLNQRKHQCRFCPQAFHERRILVNHERRHTGEKPHKCEVCDKRFIQKVALRVHMKTHTNTSENFIQS